MNKETSGAPDEMRKRFYHGTRNELNHGDLIKLGNRTEAENEAETNYVYLTPNMDAAVWEAELADGEGPARVYIVEPIGQVQDTTDSIDQISKSHPSMTWRSSESLRVVGEVTEWPLYHGTRADLKPGNLIKPGHSSNFSKTGRTLNHVYMSRTLDAAAWGAELAVGEGRGRIYIVEPTGSIEEDPNLTNKKFRGNPTKSFRSREPLRITGEITDWNGHSPEAIKAMKDGLRRLEQDGTASIED